MNHTNIFSARLNKIRVIIVVLTLFKINTVNAKQIDTLSVMRQYLSVSNVFRKTPVHVEAEIKSSSNCSSQPDTIVTETQFYTYSQGVYITTGMVEQIANDSLMLFIQKNTKQMSLYFGKVARYKNMFGMAGTEPTDSAVQRVGAIYQVDTLNQNNSGSNEVGFIQLSARRKTPNTTLPIQTMKLVYNVNTGLPVQVIHINRQLLKIDSSVYASYSQNPLHTGKIITTAKGHFLLQEKTTTYQYKNISFNDSVPLPISVTDCIRKNEEGTYVPIGNYATFTLKQFSN